jgi:hypothetical protein
MNFKPLLIARNKGCYKISSSESQYQNNDSIVITGRILDIKSNNPLPYSRLEIAELKRTYFADDSGYFNIKLKPGLYRFMFACVGNMTVNTKNVKIEARKKYVLNAYLDSFVLY